MVKILPKRPYPNSLKQYRKHYGLERVDIARFIGLKKTKELTHWEKGVALPDLINLFKLCVLYKAIPFELYRELIQRIVDEMHKLPSGKPLPTIEF